MARNGTMTNEERLQKTIRLEKPDKILSGPAIEQFAATYAGITQADFLDPDKAEAALDRTFDELGGWDLMGMSPGTRSKPFATLKTLLPGRDLPDNAVAQIFEEEVMQPEDYDFAIRNGFDALQKRLALRTNPNQPPPEEIVRLAVEKENRAKKYRAKWLARGVAFLIGGGPGSHPFEFFSFHRSLARFSMDLRRMPDKVKAAVEACIPDMIAMAKKEVEASGIRRVNFPNSRGSSAFINAKLFEELVLPSWLQFVNAMAAEDIDVIFHCDTDWTRFLPYFREFPRGRCVLQLDGATDIFKAKEILRDHMAIMGDVPAPLLSMGTPAEVTAYCRKLINVVGEGGGFILSSGCSTPHDSKIENVRAMVNAGNELTWY